MIVCRVQGRLRGRHKPPHDGASGGGAFKCGRRTLRRQRVHPITRNGSAHVPAGTSRRAQRANANCSSDQAAAPAVRSNISPDFSIACIVTASLRATATTARLKPTRFRRSSPQVRNALSAELRVSVLQRGAEGERHPYPVIAQATRTEFGRPRSSMRLRTLTAMATSVT